MLINLNKMKEIENYITELTKSSAIMTTMFGCLQYVVHRIHNKQIHEYR